MELHLSKFQLFHWDISLYRRFFKFNDAFSISTTFKHLNVKINNFILILFLFYDLIYKYYIQ